MLRRELPRELRLEEAGSFRPILGLRTPVLAVGSSQEILEVRHLPTQVEDSFQRIINPQAQEVVYFLRTISRPLLEEDCLETAETKHNQADCSVTPATLVEEVCLARAIQLGKTLAQE